MLLGTNAIRTGLHDKAWIISLFSDYNSDCKWIIDDVRFKNEAYAVKERGGFLIRIEGDPAKIRANSTRDMSHPSETDLDDFDEWDSLYKNVGTLANLETYAKLILAKVS